MNEAVWPLNKQYLDGNRTNENSVYSRARALNQWSRSRDWEHVSVSEAEVESQASKKAAVGGQQAFEHKNQSVKWPKIDTHSSATHIHLALIGADGANSYRKNASLFSLLFQAVMSLPINSNQ